MRNFTMKRLLVSGSMLLFAVASSVMLGGCSEYDDTALRKDVDDLKNRIEALEGQLEQVNSEIEALWSAVNGKLSIAKVEPITNGYKIIFTDNSSIDVTNGKDGADAPVVGVKKDTDGVYYWTLTVGGQTDWLRADGEKLRVTGESVKPVLSVDANGYWIISYDGNKDHFEQILDQQENPVLAVGEDSGVASLFRSITEDDYNVYFELSNGTIITVAKRSDFYMLIRKAPEVAAFVYAETKVYDVEAVGVEKVVISKPGEWRVSYTDNKLTVTAPAETHAACADTEGEVSIIYFSANGQSDAVKMGVVVERDYKGVTAGDDFTIDITAIADKTVTASVTPADKDIYYYVTAYSRSLYDQSGEANFIQVQLDMFNYYLGYGLDYYLDEMLHKGAFTFNGTQLKSGSEFYIAVFGIEVDRVKKLCTAVTPVMAVPFKTTSPVVINTQYRISVSDVSWYGATYVSVPTDDLGYFHGFVKKSQFETFTSDAEFMKSVDKKFSDSYFNALYTDRVITWSALTSTGTQSRQSPDFKYNETLYNAGLEDITSYTMPLVQNTDYFVYSFASSDGDATSPLSKAAFRTGKFSASEKCTFAVTTSVDRQDVTIKVVPSSKNCSYIVSLTETSYYGDFEDNLQFATDDIFWTRIGAQENDKTISDYLAKGDSERTYTNNKAATGYEVCVYGCTADGVITTEPVMTHVVTKGTIDGAPVRTTDPRSKRIR